MPTHEQLSRYAYMLVNTALFTYLTIGTIDKLFEAKRKCGGIFAILRD
jgi:hypothetical protein